MKKDLGPTIPFLQLEVIQGHEVLVARPATGCCGTSKREEPWSLECSCCSSGPPRLKSGAEPEGS